jgi:DNA-binding PadR family transcriptional regulator
MNRPVPDEVILGLLKAQPTHGYELLEYFRSPTALGRIWTMSTSQLYAVLKRLANNGDILGKVLDVPNAPARVEYMVSEEGNQKLEAWLYDLNPSASIHRIRILFLSRVYIANLLNTPLEAIIATQLSSCQAQQDILFAHRVDSQSEIEQLTLDFVISQLNAAINWLKQSQFSIKTTPKGEEYQYDLVRIANTHPHKSS